MLVLGANIFFLTAEVIELVELCIQKLSLDHLNKWWIFIIIGPIVLPAQHNNVEENRNVPASSDICRPAEMRQSCVQTDSRAFHSPRVVFLPLIDPITLSKTASTVPYGEAIKMEIQLVLMDILPIINLCCEGDGSGGEVLQTNCCSRGGCALC